MKKKVTGTTKRTRAVDPRNVFVVHGRNTRARRAMFAFLRSINLKPLEWSQVVEATGKSSPYIGEILAQGFAMANAAVVLATPDDEARLKREFLQPGDGDSERDFTGQPRQNVLFEAGMALGLHDEHTVIVELGRLRPMSDTLGRHVIKMDGTPATRQQLAQRLQAAGCNVNMDGTDWHTEGDFEAAIAGEVAPSPSDPTAETESTPTASPAQDDGDKKSPTPADFVNLGEFLWYLSNPPRAHVDNIATAIRGFLDKLNACKLPNTRAAASKLASLRLVYYLQSNYISDVSLDQLAAMMVPIRSALETEARSKGLP